MTEPAFRTLFLRLQHLPEPQPFTQNLVWPRKLAERPLVRTDSASRATRGHSPQRAGRLWATTSNLLYLSFRISEMCLEHLPHEAVVRMT